MSSRRRHADLHEAAHTEVTRGADSGDTLLEVLFAIIVLAIASVALLVAFATSISASATHRNVANFDTAIRSAAQQAVSEIQQQTSPLFEQCSTTDPTAGSVSYYNGVLTYTNLPAGYTATVTSVQYWNGTTFSSTCGYSSSNPTSAYYPEWITLKVTNPAGTSYTDNFIVDDPYAPPVPAQGPAYQLVFAQQPAGATVSSPFSTQPVIRVEDQNGNLVTTDLSPVTLAITPGTGATGANLSSYCVGNETSGVVTFSGCSIDTAGFNYQLTATDPGLISAFSSLFNVYIQLTTPVITAATPSTTTSGAINVSFTGSTNAPTGETYTATACANSGIGFGCVTQTPFTSGSQISGLTPGTNYYVTITANAPSSLYLPATSATVGPTPATVQLNAPGTPSLAYGTVPGSIAVSFATPTPVATNQVYTATACTNSAMTAGCVSGSVAPGGNLTGLAWSGGSPGTSYYVEVVAAASTGFLVSPSSGEAGPQAAVSAVNTPTGFSTASSLTTAGDISDTFTASAGPQLPSSYTATSCTDAAMTQNCVTNAVGAGTTQLTGLTAGTLYYTTITANSPAAGYLSATTAVSGPTRATTQLTTPSNLTVGYGSVAGSVSVTFTAPANASAGQTYTVVVCTNAAMTTGCATNANFTSGNNFSGLAYTAGTAGSTYYATVQANGSSAYFASGVSTDLSHADTSALTAPGTPTGVTSTTVAGGVVVTFAASTGISPASYTATACTNGAMTNGCVSGAITSGGTLSGLSQGVGYYLRITANPPAGFIAAVSAVSTGTAISSVQLATPVISAVTPSTTTAGQITITYTGSSNAPGGQTYTATACTDVAMTQNCVVHTSYTSGSQFTGLTAGTQYYATITAVASSGYIASTSAASGPALATVQLLTPSTPVLAYGPLPGTILVTTSSSNAPSGQLYTVKSCSNSGMTLSCVSQIITSGSAITIPLSYTQGSPGNTYYVNAFANASSGYLASGTSLVAGPQAATSEIGSPTSLTVVPSSTTSGALVATFTASGGPSLASYTATACTNAAMTTGCVTVTNYTSGAQLTGLVGNTNYYVTITALSSSAAYGPATTTDVGPTLATYQLPAPTITAVAPSTTTAGQITITYTGSVGAPGGQSYTAVACTNAAMTTGCVTHTNYTSGSQFTGLTAGTNYYVTLQAVASTGYLSVTTADVGPTLATVQLTTPTGVTLAYGTVAGSVKVTFAGSSNAPGGQLYTATACTNNTMTNGCVSGTIVSGGNLTGLNYFNGFAGTNYYVTVVAAASPGYLASPATAVAGPQADTSQLNLPTGFSTAPSTTTAGAITATFTAPTGTAPSSYTATICTNAAMTTGCTTVTNYTSGAQLTGLTQGTGYYVTITALSSNGAYASSTTGVSGPTIATVQLATPTGVTLAYGTVAGSIKVTFTGSTNAATGQTYTVKACTNSAMTTGCVTAASFASGSNLTGLAYTAGTVGTSYYVTVTANASTGYLASAATAAVGPQADLSALTAPGTPTVASSVTTTGAITATFASSTGTAPTSYTATACTNVAMTAGCVVQTTYTSGSQFTGLTPGTAYYVQISALAPAGYASATSAVSASSALATSQLGLPTIVSIQPSSTTVGQIVIVYTGSSNAPNGQNYTATACTDALMTQGCVAHLNYISGSAFTGLVAGTSYDVTITAVASPGYLAATTASYGPTLATVQLNAPSILALNYGSTAGAINVSFSASSNAPSGETYTVKACTNVGMTANCTSVTPFSSSTDMSIPLSYTVGSPGTAYYVTVSANPAAGYLTGTSAVAGPQSVLSQLSAPGTPVVTPSTTTAGAITVTFAAPSGTAGASYTARACTDAAMTLNCITVTNFTSGSQITGLAQGTSYYVQITANPPTGFLGSVSAVSAAGTATSQLLAPTGVTLGYGTVAGSVSVTFTGSSNAPGGQTYTAKACTNAAMTTGCITNAAFSSGGNLSGLAFTQGAAGTPYYVTLTANASTGWLASAPSTVAGPQADTSQLNVPTGLTTASSTTTAGAITATFTAPTGTAPSSYTATICTNAAMTTGCTTVTNYTSGAQLTGLTAGTTYYVTITANAPSSAYVSSTTAVSAGAVATRQLVAPTLTSVLPSTTTAGQLTITYAGSSNAPGGQTYTATACTDAGMSLGCVSHASYVSGSQFTGLTAGTSYYVTVTAVASAGYLAATTAAYGPTLATVQLTAATGVSVAYGTAPGSVAVSFTGSSNAPGGQLYSVTACTNVTMTTGCVTSSPFTSGSNVTGLAFTAGVAGTNYYATVTALASSGYLASTTAAAGPHADTSQLNAPGTPTVTSSTTTAGAVTATFTAPTGTAPSSYSATACTNAGMTTGCVTQNAYTSGAQLTGLTQGTAYYVQITANPPAGFAASTSGISGSSAIATTQLTTPSTPVLTYGASAGSINASSTSSNASGGQTYTVKACTNAGMTTGCVTNTTFTSGSDLTGLAYTQGSAGTTYYVTVTANASAGYLASATSVVGGPQADTSKLNAPGTPTVASSTTTAGAITATFTASTGTAPASYTATACTNAGMTTGCVTQNAYTSGAQLTGLTQGTAYYVQITANAPVGYVATTSATSASSAVATVQLAAPTGVTLAYGTVAGSVKVTFTASANAPGGQTYTVTACTNAAMTTGCVSNAAFTSGSNLTGLAYTQGAAGTAYYVTVTANVSAGYLGSATSAVAGPQNATSQVNAPGTPTVASSSTTAGAITATFTSSTGIAPASYSAAACTNAGMTTGCLTQNAYTSGAQLTGLTQGSTYYVQITANPPAGFVLATSATSASSALATVQLTAPTITSVLPSTTTAGQLTIAFTGSGNAPGGQSYTATVCTNAAMTTGCVTQTAYTSGAQVTGLTAGTSYYATITAVSSTGYLTATSATSASTMATVQLSTPAITAVTPSATTAGQITITYTGSSNAPGGQSYTAIACTNAAMTTGCVTHTGYTSGAQFTGLTAGTAYYATVTAVASSGYLAATSTDVGPTNATVQLATPTGVTLAAGTVAGSIKITFTGSSNAPGGQTYTATACTNAGMNQNCVTGPIVSGGNLTGLTYSPGAAGSNDYVQLTADPSAGYLMSNATGTAGPQAATSQLNAPTISAVAPSTTTAGALTITFSASTGQAPSSYTATICTNAAMTTGCSTVANYTSGAQLTGLTQGAAYYVTLTANSGSTGFLAATTIDVGPTLASVQLTTPSTPVLAYGASGGSINVTSTSSNAVAGQTYTVKACTNAGMTTGCITNASFTSGTDLTGLAFTAGTAGGNYYVTATANASAGYLASATSAVGGPHADTSQLNAPGTPTVASSTTTAGAITATFTSSTGTAPASYSATACTNAAMTTGCVTQNAYTSGAQLIGLTQGSSYFVQITANPPAGFAANSSAVSGSSALATTQLATPSTPVLTYGASTGSINVTSTSSNASGSQTYTVKACTNVGMTTGCVTNAAFTSGNDLTGLAFTQGSVGTSYYVTVTANASAGYFASGVSATGGPQADTSKLNAPGTPTVATSTTTPGAITATFTSSTGTAPSSYTATACTNTAMTLNCATQTSYTSGAQFTGLTTGLSYYVQITANPPAGFLANNSAVSATSALPYVIQLTTPTISGVALDTGQNLVVTFTGSTNAPGGQTYTATACTNAAMTQNCVTQTSYTSGAQFTGLNAFTNYYVTITAVASNGYLAATSAVNGPTFTL